MVGQHKKRESFFAVLFMLCLSRAVAFNPGPQGPMSCMFLMFPCSNTPGSNEWSLTGFYRDPHSFESGVFVNLLMIGYSSRPVCPFQMK